MSTIKSILEELSEDSRIYNEESPVADEFEKESLRERKLSNDLIREKLDNRKQDREQRKEYSDKIFEFLCVFLFFVGLIVFMSGFESCHFKLSDNVLMALLTTASANVISIFVIVVRYLFNVPPDGKKRKETDK
jgi:hypothetical protein